MFHPSQQNLKFAGNLTNILSDDEVGRKTWIMILADIKTVSNYFASPHVLTQI